MGISVNSKTSSLGAWHDGGAVIRKEILEVEQAY